MISFFEFTWETAGAEDNDTVGESLNKSSIPDVDWGLLSAGLAESFFSWLGTGCAAEFFLISHKQQPKEKNSDIAIHKHHNTAIKGLVTRTYTGSHPRHYHRLKMTQTLSPLFHP